MKYSYRLPLLILLVATGCAGPPTIYHYLLHLDPITPSNQPAPVNVGLYPLEIEPVYSNYEIAYQSSPYQIQFYHYHQWATNPSGLVDQTILNYLKTKNSFTRVMRMPSPGPVDVIVRGRILRIGEWNEAERWFGFLEIEFLILRTRSEEILWQGNIARRIPTEKRNPVSVVKAISQATREIADELAQRIKQNFQER